MNEHQKPGKGKSTGARNLIRLREALALVVLLLIFHGFEGLCYVIGNLYPYYQAVAFYGLAAGLASLLLIYLHDFLKARYGWDVLGLQYLNDLRRVAEIPPYRIFARLTRYILRQGYWAIFICGPVVLGPFVSTLLLRPQKDWSTNLIYAGCGALFNALAWIAFMKGVGMLTWKYAVSFF